MRNVPIYSDQYNGLFYDSVKMNSLDGFIFHFVPSMIRTSRCVLREPSTFNSTRIIKKKKKLHIFFFM